jgi:transaldolase
MRNNVAILTLLILGGTACGQQVKREAHSKGPKTVQEEPMVMSLDKAYQLWKEKSHEVVILDVRTPGEYQRGHVRGTTNLDYYC